MADIFSYEDMLNALEQLTPEQRRELFTKLEVIESGHSKAEDKKDIGSHIKKDEDGIWR